jgi:multidrug resistance efflux pump
MKKMNFHLIAFIFTSLALVTFNWQYGNETFVFFGFAENKEMEIRLENSISLHAIYVTAGMRVNKDDVLLEATRIGLEEAQSDLNHEVAKIESQLLIWESDIKASIGRLQAQKNSKISEIQTQIDQMESEMNINQSLIKDLESIKPAKDKAGKSPNEIKVDGLKRELELAIKPIDAEIRKLKYELYASENPLKIQIQNLKQKLGFVHQEEENLTITAPSDGIVGSVFCKVGEQMPAFTNLITFYEENPTQVKGYVLESLILKVKMGDSIIVQSGVSSSFKCMGTVIGMGSRVVEIPERLRKNPMFKTYGREILIEIPEDNNFLQKEKVVLKLPNEIKDNNRKIKAFTTPQTSAAAISTH